MYSILDESDNEKSTSKGRNAFIEFQEFYDTIIIIILAPMKPIKDLYHVLMINDIS